MNWPVILPTMKTSKIFLTLNMKIILVQQTEKQLKITFGRPLVEILWKSFWPTMISMFLEPVSARKDGMKIIVHMVPVLNKTNVVHLTKMHPVSFQI